MADIQTPPFANDPLLQGVEDNPVYRLLFLFRKKLGWRRFGRTAEIWFPFEPAVWSDLDVLPIGARDFAQGLWAYRAAKTYHGKKRHWIRIVASLAALASAAFLVNEASTLMRTAAAGVITMLAVYIFVTLFRWLFDDGAALRRATDPLASLPGTVFARIPLHDPRFYGFLRSIAMHWIPLLFAIAAMMARVGDFVFTPGSVGRMACEFTLFGIVMILFGVLHSRFMLRYAQSRREELFTALTQQIGEQLDKRRNA